MDANTKKLLEAGRAMAKLLAKDPAGVEMATGIYTEEEATEAIRAWDRTVLDLEASNVRG